MLLQLVQPLGKVPTGTFWGAPELALWTSRQTHQPFNTSKTMSVRRGRWHWMGCTSRSWWGLLSRLWALSTGDAVFILCCPSELSPTTLSLSNSFKTLSWWFLYKCRASRKKNPGVKLEIKCWQWALLFFVGIPVTRFGGLTLSLFPVWDQLLLGREERICKKSV